MRKKTDITLLLAAISEGKKNAVNELIPLVYDELRHMAGNKLRNEKFKQTLNATALVHEAYLKLVDQSRVVWQNRAHFFAIAARAMRRIIINHANERLAQKRGGGQEVITLNEESAALTAKADELIVLDEALSRLEKLNDRQSKIAEYWLFVGLSHQEISELMDVSLSTVRRDWRVARAWLSKECKDLILD